MPASFTFKLQPLGSAVYGTATFTMPAIDASQATQAINLSDLVVKVGGSTASSGNFSATPTANFAYGAFQGVTVDVTSSLPSGFSDIAVTNGSVTGSNGFTTLSGTAYYDQAATQATFALSNGIAAAISYTVPWSSLNASQATQSLSLTNFTIGMAGAVVTSSNATFSTAPSMQFAYGAITGLTFGADTSSLASTAGFPFSDVSASVLLATAVGTVVVTVPDGGSSTVSGTVTITDPRPVVTVEALSNAYVNGNDGAFRFHRTGGDLSSSLVVTYLVGGTALPGDEYTALSTSVTFSANSDTADVSVHAIGLDEDHEPVALVSVGVDDTSTYLAGSPAGAFVEITEVTLPVVTVEKIADAAEGGGNGLFRFQRTSNDLSSGLTISYVVGGTAVAGTHYSALSGSVTIPAGASEADVVVAPIANSFAGTAKTVVLAVSTNSAYTIGSNDTATVTITDEEAGTISGYVWADEDGDGEEDTGEGGFADATVLLLNDAGDQVDATSTDSNGDYSFSGVTAGAYTLSFVPSLGGSVTSPVTGTLDVTVTAGQNTAAENAGEAADKAGSITLNKPTVAGSSISGDGTFDKGKDSKGQDATWKQITLFAAESAGKPTGTGRLYKKDITTDPGGTDWGTAIADLPKGTYDVWAVMVVRKDGKDRFYTSKIYRGIEVKVGMPDNTAAGIRWGVPEPKLFNWLAKDEVAITGKVIIQRPAGYDIDRVTAFLTLVDGGEVYALPMRPSGVSPNAITWNISQVNRDGQDTDMWLILREADGTKYRITAAVNFKKQGGTDEQTYTTSPVTLEVKPWR